MEQLIDNPEFELLMIDASLVKVHSQGSGARGGNQDMAKTKGGSIPRYVWPWMRMVCRSESLLQKVPQRMVSRLKLIDGIDAKVLLTDRVYDSDAIVEKAEKAGTKAVIPQEETVRFSGNMIRSCIN